ncbi:hypothetical protein ACC719_35635, partial [Rhizobium ruizarguesonis]
PSLRRDRQPFRQTSPERSAAAQHDLTEAEKRMAEVARKEQATVERQAQRDSTGRKMAAKGGITRIMLGGMKERSETTGGDNARLA